MTARKFHYHIRRRDYYTQYGLNHEKPNLRTRITAFIIEILPKVGPLRALKFTPPTGEAERLFVKAFDASSAHFALIIGQLKDGRDPQLADVVERLMDPAVRSSFAADQLAHLTSTLSLALRNVYILSAILGAAMVLIGRKLPAVPATDDG